ncbi:MAG: branched-chain amino acid ABC transporter permease, partial [Cyanobacteria bacterium P01_F01_bin.42]
MVDYLVFITILIAISALFGLGLNLQWGFTGLVNFGHVAFMTVGAYTTALLSINGIPGVFDDGVPLVLAVLIGMLLSAVLGAIVGFSTLRLREDYLAIVTIGVSEVVRLTALNEEQITNGSRGIYGYALPLEGLNPSMPIKLLMASVLLGITGIGLWRIWQWMIDQIQAFEPSQMLRSLKLKQLGFTGYLASLTVLVTLLWQGLTNHWGYFIVSAIGPALTAIAGFSQFKSPVALLKSAPRLLPARIAAANIAVGFTCTLIYAGCVSIVSDAYSAKTGLMWLLLVILSLVFWRLERLVQSPWGRVLKAVREDEEVVKALGK